MTREGFLDQHDRALLVASFEEVVAEIPLGDGRAPNVSARLRELESFEVDRLRARGIGIVGAPEMS